MPGTDEAALVQRARNLNHAAIGALYRRHVQAVYRYIYYRVGNAHTAEDLTAEVFLRAIEGLPEYESRGTPFRSWLYRIAQARVADHFREAQHTGLAPIAEDLPSDEESCLARSERAFECEELRQAVAQLTPDQQQVIGLKFVQGLSNAEVAAALGKTEGAVKALQYRALNALHKLMKKPDEET